MTTVNHLMRSTAWALLITLPSVLHAQTYYTVSGTVRDKKTGEVLIGATISLLERPRSGILSNSYGFYSVSAAPGHYILIVSFTGYLADTLSINLDRDTRLPVEISPEGVELEAVVVSAQKKNDNVSRPLMGVQKLSTNEIRNVPVLFGEK